MTTIETLITSAHFQRIKKDRWDVTLYRSTFDAKGFPKVESIQGNTAGFIREFAEIERKHRINLRSAHFHFHRIPGSQPDYELTRVVCARRWFFFREELPVSEEVVQGVMEKFTDVFRYQNRRNSRALHDLEQQFGRKREEV